MLFAWVDLVIDEMKLERIIPLHARNIYLLLDESSSPSSGPMPKPEHLDV